VNIVFDLGGVLVTWEPSEFIKSTVKNKQKQQVLRTEILDHPDWIALDRGTLSSQDAIQRGAKRTGLPKTEIERMLEAVPPFLTPVPESIQLLNELKKNDNNLFVLSNMHIASITYLENNYSFLDLFDGKIISCRINKVKPEPDIYEYLLCNYRLLANDTIFIDDVEINVKAAANIGLKTIKFENPNQCRRELEALGCIF